MFDIEISIEFVCRGLIDNKSTLIETMAWRRTGAKPLSEPMMYTDTHMHHQAAKS